MRTLYAKLSTAPFPGSKLYWERRYASGGNSGSGAYNRLAEYKAEFINSFVSENAVESVIEFGCGDGNQLSLAKYPRYIGLDVAPTALSMCRERFGEDLTKNFFLYDPHHFVDNHGIFTADLALSLDVIYHLIEDDVYEAYMKHLFGAAGRFVIIYSSNQSEDCTEEAHVKRREFTPWVAAQALDWTLLNKVENPYPFDPRRPRETTLSNFYVFTKSAESP